MYATLGNPYVVTIKMPVTEFVKFRFKEPYTLDNEEVCSQFRKVSAWQSEWSNYPLTFYKSVEDPALLYLLSGWKDVDAHGEWIKSERNQNLLQIFDPILTIVDFVHLKIDFAVIPSDTQLLLFREEENDGSDNSIRDLRWLEEHLKGVKSWCGQGRAIEKPREYYLATFCDTSYLTIEKELASRWTFLQRVYFGMKSTLVYTFKFSPQSRLESCPITKSILQAAM